MPTPDQEISVINRIKELQEATYHCPEDGFPRPSPGQETKGHHREVMSGPDSWDTWSGLSKSEVTNLLETQVSWEGFSEGQKDDVIRRVLGGEEPDFWMDGIETVIDSPEPIGFFATIKKSTKESFFDKKPEPKQPEQKSKDRGFEL